MTRTGSRATSKLSRPLAYTAFADERAGEMVTARLKSEILRSLQAKEMDNYRDAEPGKILHEMRYGELAHFKRIPHTSYYGTADATPLYLITLHAAWRATGDRALLGAAPRDRRGMPVLD